MFDKLQEKKFAPAFAIAIVITTFISCKENAAPENKVKKEDTTREAKDSSITNSRIKNGIILQAKWVKVNRAFLLYQNGKLVSPSNKTTVGQSVKMRLIIDSGWTVVAGKVSLGASEKIRTNDGKLVVNEKDLFQNKGVLSVEEARYITLTANIAQLDKPRNYFIISFRVWDKKGPAEVQGRYKLYVK